MTNRKQITEYNFSLYLPSGHELSVENFPGYKYPKIVLRGIKAPHIGYPVAIVQDPERLMKFFEEALNK